jgi:hypothetical protein
MRVQGQSSRPRVSVGAALLVLLLLVGSMALTNGARRKASALRATWPAEADLMYLPPSGTLRWLALGHYELASDLVAARANVYYGTQLFTKVPNNWLDRYVHTAIDLDPKFKRLYGSGAAMVIYYGGAITPETVLKANAILERGIKAFPTEWEFYFQLGFNKFFELANAAGKDDPRVPGWRQEGVEALRQAANFDGTPYWLPSLAAQLLTKQGAEDLAVRHLEQAYAITSNEKAREEIRLKLERLKHKQLLREVEEGRRQFEAQLERSYSYADEAFSVLTGPRRPRWVELPSDGPPAAEGHAQASPATSPPPPTKP